MATSHDPKLTPRVVRVPRTLTWRQKLRSSTRGFSNALRLIRISILPATTLHLRMLKFGPNVQDEPRPWLARLVLLGARGVTAMVVGSGALLGFWRTDV